MADIRINSLPTTATTSASDDYIAIDGAANGTRKLSVYSPTFGGNLTVSGTGTSSVAGAFSILAASPTLTVGDGTGSPAIRINRVSASGNNPIYWATAGTNNWFLGSGATGVNTNWQLYSYGAGLAAIDVSNSTGSVTLGANLTVSGTGTSSVAGQLSVSSASTSGQLLVVRSTGNTGYSDMNFRDDANNSVLSFGYGNSGGVSPFASSVYLQAVSSSAPIKFIQASTVVGMFAATSGNLLLGTTTDDRKLTVVQSTTYVEPTLGTATGGFTLKGSSGLYGLYAGVSGSGSTWFQAMRNDAATAYNIELQPSGGNVLIGTATDSSNGKLQLATHTTSAGGIGFGTDVSLYRNAANQVSFIGGGAAPIGFALSSGNPYIFGAAGGSFIRFNSSGQLDLVTATATSLTLQTNFTTALTLDSSQRCILAGALRLNNAYAAGAPAATGYVTIQDSSGTTYKVLVST